MSELDPVKVPRRTIRQIKEYYDFAWASSKGVSED